ncbi:MAG: bifunctional phosphoribosylaminoimidazolecarboxamide formyltransferase/IMP cyclohydrolase [Anaerolineaceae bacterium]|nr:bifunctional phosphoribosylaminoimidazolecarboxamide formyltransferase/IMP cyclohydrolase [Anaerolineaceae bacterium]MDE0329850.1 bifunctional phosphoribosylaminoimidazolecarboxamide formyltransferase/IMP cyclohydrolase [Anaerolineaceae bacterium]
MPRALLSVSDKSGLIDLARALIAAGHELVASGGTARTLSGAGLPVTPVDALTDQQELLGGRVKTLHPALHAGILARDTAADLAELEQAGFAPIDVVVCNLYPFREVSGRQGSALEEAIEQIDIGGVALLRAAAKNFSRVITLCDPEDYGLLEQALSAGTEIDLAARRSLAAKVFELTQAYDAAIHSRFRKKAQDSTQGVATPARLTQTFYRSEVLRYGENPHQQAAWYSQNPNAGPLGGELLGGQRQLSYNNYLDLDVAARAVRDFPTPTVAVVKHLSPIGLASDEDLSVACQQAMAADPLSSFGSVLATNRPVSTAFIAALGKTFVEAIVAPDFDVDALAMLGAKRKNCRLLRLPDGTSGDAWQQRSVTGGLLMQSADEGDPIGSTWRSVTAREPDEVAQRALAYAWRAVQHVPSNAIVIANPCAVVGVGGGLPSRVDAVVLAVRKAGGRAQGAALASDAFFPFADGIEAAIAAGIVAVIQPGGSVRDAEVIAAADEGGIAMVFTGVRHFRH